MPARADWAVPQSRRRPATRPAHAAGPPAGTGRARRRAAGAVDLKLHSISLQNFKSFGDETTIPTGQITYLIGPNGAGKSNVLHGLETLSAIITGGDYAPEQGDYFDNDTDREMKLSAVVELSDVERQEMAARIKTRPLAISRGGLAEWLFRRLKCETSFNGTTRTHTISLTFASADLHVFMSVEHDGNRHTGRRRRIEAISTKVKLLPDLESYDAGPTATVSALLEEIDKPLASKVNDLFSGVAYTTTQRHIPKSTPVRESRGITSDGSNILNELNDLPRTKQQEFDRFLSAMTGKSLLGVEPRVRGSELVIEATEPDLRRKTPHTDFGSGHNQLVLLALQLFTKPGTIFMLAEPELHLHPRAQKQVRAGLKDASAKLQIVIETHSPVFLGTDRGETTLLITKDRGSSHITPIITDNMDVIRHELGITHYDALYHENILFVEGGSEHEAFPKFLDTLGYTHAPKTAIFNLGGVGRLRHLGPLLQYFKGEGRKVFVILDGNATARSSIATLKRDGVLDKNFLTLDKDFEDAFASKILVDAVSAMARQFGCEFDLSKDDLDHQRSEDKHVAAILRKHWKKATGHDFSKVDLAKSLAALPRRDIPDEIKGALRAAMAYLGDDTGDSPGHGYGPKTSHAPGRGKHSRKMGRPVGDPARLRPLLHYPGGAARHLLKGRNILSASSYNFAVNEYYRHLHSPLPDDEKPAVLFTACPNDLVGNADVTAPEFVEWVEATTSVEVDGRQVRVPGLEPHVDIGRLLAIDQSPRAPSGRNILTYREFQSNGLFEFGTSHLFFDRNGRGNMEMHLCHMVGEFWSFLAQARLFYRRTGLDFPFTAFASVKNSDRLRLGNYGDEVLRRLSRRSVPSGRYSPVTHRRNIPFWHAFGPDREATDEEIALAAKEMAKQVCNAYGETIPRCYNKDGSFSWDLWITVARNSTRGG